MTTKRALVAMMSSAVARPRARARAGDSGAATKPTTATTGKPVRQDTTVTISAKGFAPYWADVPLKRTVTFTNQTATAQQIVFDNAQATKRRSAPVPGDRTGADLGVDHGHVRELRIPLTPAPRVGRPHPGRPARGALTAARAEPLEPPRPAGGGAPRPGNPTNTREGRVHMLKGKGRHAKLGVFLAITLSLLVLGAPAANADTAPHGNRFSGAGSDVTFKVGTDLDAIYNESPAAPRSPWPRRCSRSTAAASGRTRPGR